MKPFRSSWLFFVCVVSACAVGAPEADISQAKAALSRLPLRFEANQGQWSSKVRYGARTGAGALLLTQNGPVLAGGGRSVEIALLHGNPTARIEPLDPLRARTNYFVGNKRQQWRTGIQNFTRVAYRAVYPGIDIVYYGNQNQLEYDFVLGPGADARAIRMEFRGAERVHLSSEGDLVVDGEGAQFIQRRPVIYQEDPETAERRPVEGHYEMLARDVVGVRLSPYDRTRPLVIDPVVTYSVFIGGAATDVVNAVTMDSQGFIYIAGTTHNGDLQNYGNAVVGYSAGADGFIAKMDPNQAGAATWVYFSYLGGGRDDSVTAIQLDAAGNIYATGTTTSSDFPLAGAAVQTTLSLSSTSTSSVFPTDAFVTVVSPTDGLLYSTYYGGSGNETPAGVALGPNGFLYILGTTTSPDLPVTANAIGSVSWGPSDVFAAIIDPNSSTLVYGTYVGGESSDDARGMAVGRNGLVYFAASTFSQQFPVAGAAYRGALQGIENLVIGVIDPSQSGLSGLVYSTYFGGSVLDEVRKMRLDRNGKLLLTGWTISPDFPVTANAMQTALKGSPNAFVARVNPAAQPGAFVEYSTFLGGSVGDVAYDVTSDATDNIYVTGYTLSSDFPTQGSLQAYGNGIDVFLVRLNPAVAGRSAVVFGTYLGGVGTHVGQGVALGPNGSIALGGYTTSDWHLPAALNAYNGGGSDGFVVLLK